MIGCWINYEIVKAVEFITPILGFLVVLISCQLSLGVLLRLWSSIAPLLVSLVC